MALRQAHETAYRQCGDLSGMKPEFQHSLVSPVGIIIFYAAYCRAPKRCAPNI